MCCQGADEVDGEEADRYHGENASTSVLCDRITARHAVHFSATTWFIAHVGVVTRAGDAFEQRVFNPTHPSRPRRKLIRERRLAKGKNLQERQSISLPPRIRLARRIRPTLKVDTG
jgi:hypothetical protein